MDLSHHSLSRQAAPGSALDGALSVPGRCGGAGGAAPAAARQASGPGFGAVGKKNNRETPVTASGFLFPTSPLSGASRQILRHVRDGRWEWASEDAHL